jgi:hypothetical protein
MTASAALRTYRDLRRIHRGAVGQAKLGYDFSPNSYSYCAMSSCLAAEAALDVLREALEADQMEGDAA